MPLQQNLEIAAAAVAAVKALNYKSSNRSEMLNGLSEDASKACGVAANQLFGATYMDLLDAAGSATQPDGLDSFVATVSVAKRLQFGNCEARAGLALIYAAKKHAVRPLELFSVGEDHAFLVIGRTAGDIPKPATWNEEAVICDPWAEIYYAKGEIDVRLKQEPVKEMVGDAPGLRQYFEHRVAGWPPAALKSFLDKADLSDLWP